MSNGLDTENISLAIQAMGIYVDATILEQAVVDLFDEVVSGVHAVTPVFL